GVGWGEVVTQAEPFYSSEYTQGAWDVLTRFLAPTLLQRRTVAPEEVTGILAPVVGHRMAKAGLELAVIDAALRAEG
ncbi:o-succinylbenzoate synthase, partial [Vibrio parahaemolyticus]